MCHDREDPRCCAVVLDAVRGSRGTRDSSVYHDRKSTVRCRGTKPLNVGSEYGKIGFSGVEVGMSWSKEDFVKEANEVIHPFDLAVKVPQRIAEVIYNSAVGGKTWTEEERTKSLS